MMAELSKRFRYPGGTEMNGFWIDKELTQEEYDICVALVRSGPMGLDEKGLRGSKIAIEEVETLVEEGIIAKKSTLELAKAFVENENNRLVIEEMEKEGGFLAQRNREKRDWFRLYKQLMKIAEEGETEVNLKERYQVISVLYAYLELMY
jgi:hypothetical protein